MIRVVLTAGFSRAYHVLLLAERLRRAGVSIDGLLVVSPFSWKRARSLVRQRGAHFLLNAARRLAGFKGAAAAEDGDELDRMIAAHDVAKTSLKKWAREHGVEYLEVKSLNDDEPVGFLAKTRPDWVVYGGGGILHNSFIDAAEGRILNAHSGPLPEIRGMNACEWSLLLGIKPTVTIHLINRGIDTGGRLKAIPIPVHQGDTVESLRGRCVATGVEALYQTVLEPPDVLPAPAGDAGTYRQCFVLAPALREVLVHRLSSGRYNGGNGRDYTSPSR